jgi:hypothetical protein
VNPEQRFDLQAQGVFPGAGLVEIGGALPGGQLQSRIENSDLAIRRIIHRRFHTLLHNAKCRAKRIEEKLWRTNAADVALLNFTSL